MDLISVWSSLGKGIEIEWQDLQLEAPGIEYGVSENPLIWPHAVLQHLFSDSQAICMGERRKGEERETSFLNDCFE